MKLVYGRRGCGKTRRLIKWSARTGGWILAWSQESKKFIEHQIREMNLFGKAHVFWKGDVAAHKNIPPQGTKVSIDEFQYLLQGMFPQYEIEEITTSMKKIRLRGGIKDDEKHN